MWEQIWGWFKRKFVTWSINIRNAELPYLTAQKQGSLSCRRVLHSTNQTSTYTIRIFSYVNLNSFSLLICSARRAIADSPKLAIHTIHRRQALSQLIVAAKSTCRGQRFSVHTKSTLPALNNLAYARETERVRKPHVKEKGNDTHTHAHTGEM